LLQSLGLNSIFNAVALSNNYEKYLEEF